MIPASLTARDDLRARGSRPGLAAVLLDDDRDATIARHGSKLLEPFDPEFAVASAGVAEGEHLGNATRLGLEDSPPEDVQGLVGLGVDAREHHERFQAEVATSLAQFPRPVGRRIAAEDGRLNSALLHMGCAPGDMLVSGRLDAGQGALEGELRVGQGHAGDLEPGWRAAPGRGLVAGRGSARAGSSRSSPSPSQPAGDPGARDAQPGAAVQRHQVAPWPGGHGSSRAGFPRRAHGPSRQANGVWPGMAIRATGGAPFQS